MKKNTKKKENKPKESEEIKQFLKTTKMNWLCFTAYQHL